MLETFLHFIPYCSVDNISKDKALVPPQKGIIRSKASLSQCAT